MKESILKKVQVGFDSSSGKPIYQQKEIELNLLPFLVVVVDEMADLMLSSGKEIEWFRMVQGLLIVRTP